MHFAFDRYRRWAGAISARQTGSLVAWERGGTATAHALEGGRKSGGESYLLGPGQKFMKG